MDRKRWTQVKRYGDKGTGRDSSQRDRDQGREMGTDTQKARARDAEGQQGLGKEGSQAQGEESRGQEAVWGDPVPRTLGLCWRWAATWAWRMRRRKTT